VVAEYLDKSGLQKDLDKLGYNLVGFGCTTCIGNSGLLAPEISKAINDQDLVAAAVLSGNRNFEGRVNADVRGELSRLAALVVAYALAGSMYSDLLKQPLGSTRRARRSSSRTFGRPTARSAAWCAETITKQMFTTKYANVFKGDAHWRGIKVKGGLTYGWDRSRPMCRTRPLRGHGTPSGAAQRHRRCARACLLLDSITTDHISPAGSIKVDSPRANILSSTR